MSKIQREGNQYAKTLVARATTQRDAGNLGAAAKLLCEASDYSNDQRLLAGIDETLTEIYQEQHQR